MTPMTVCVCDRCGGAADSPDPDVDRFGIDLWIVDPESADDPDGMLTVFKGDLCGPCGESLKEWMQQKEAGARMPAEKPPG
jgi:hypothetical protein